MAMLVRHLTMMLLGVPCWRYGPRVTLAVSTPVSSRLKLTSLLVAFAWWISTASVLDPATSSVGEIVVL